MQILRHSEIAVTMEVYTHVPSAETRKALRKLGEALDGSKPKPKGKKIKNAIAVPRCCKTPRGPSATITLGPLNSVGVAGFEPTTSSSRTKRAAKLRYTPMSPLAWRHRLL